MRARTELQTLLESVLGNDRVYFQPPESMKLKYPCIVYSRNTFRPTFANNDIYINRTRYTIILIDKNPDSKYVNPLEELQYCSHSRNYVADGLNHDVFDIYW